MSTATTRSPSHARRAIVIGAGISGLRAARGLVSGGFLVTVLDKGRAPGGRASTRAHAEGRFDHGAQSFTARGEAFAREALVWRERGLVAPFVGEVRGAPHDATSAPRYVLPAGMGSLAAHLAEGLDVRVDTTAEALSREGDVWRVRGKGPGSAPFELESDALVVAVPPEQARALLAAVPFEGHELLARAASVPCWALLAVFARTHVPEVALYRPDDTFAWACNDARKRGDAKAREPSAETWIFHASTSFTRKNLEKSADEIVDMLTPEATALVRAEGPPSFVRAHRWRYGFAGEALGVDALVDHSLGLAVCGDYCLGARIEDAFTSGQAAASRLST
jgi:hypothetical protein